MGSTFRALMVIFSLNLLITSVVWGSTTTAGADAFTTDLTAKQEELEALKKGDIEEGQKSLLEKVIGATQDFGREVWNAMKMGGKVLGLFWKAFMGWPTMPGNTIDVIIINAALKIFRIGLYVWVATEAFMFYLNKKTS